MRIVLARQRIGPSFGGAEGYVAMLASALRDRGAFIALLAQSVDEETRRKGYEVVTAPTRPGNAWSVWSFARTVGRYVREHADRQVISFDRIPNSRFIRAGDGCHSVYLDAMGHQARAFFSIKHRLLLCLERRAYADPGLRLIFANSRMVADDLRSVYSVPEEKIRVVCTGIPPRPEISSGEKKSVRAALKIPETQHVILFAGHNYERKGLGTLLTALGRLEARRRGAACVNWKLLVAGRGDAESYRLKAEGLGIGPAVTFLGPTPLDDLFRVADLFVLPTRYDPMARVCLEAAHAGVPVITTRKNGFAEWIPPEDGLVLENPDDAASLEIILDRALAMDLAVAGRRLKDRTSHLTIESNAEEILTHLGRMG